MEINKETEFREERKGVIINLESIAWHTNNLLCPFCMEKHASLVAGLASEIADGNEGDQVLYRELSELYLSEIDRMQTNKQSQAFTEEDLNHYRDTARTWRRKLQGATEAGHNHKKGEHRHDKDETEESPEDPEESSLYARCVAQGNLIGECRSLKNAP